MINPSIKSNKAIKKFSVLEEKKDWDPCRSFLSFFFLNSTRRAILVNIVQNNKNISDDDKVGSSYMHTRY